MSKTSKYIGGLLRSCGERKIKVMRKFSPTALLCIVLLTTLFFAGCKTKYGVVVQEEPFKKALYYESESCMTSIVSMFTADSGTNGVADIVICGQKTKHLLDGNTGRLKSITRRYNFEFPQRTYADTRLTKRVRRKHPTIEVSRQIEDCNWPGPNHILAEHESDTVGRYGFCVIDREYNVILQHSLKRQIFFLKGIPVKFCEDKAPYLAVLIGYGAARREATLCIFSPDMKLVYKEHAHKTRGILAIRSKSSKKQVLLVGDYDYDIWQGIVHKYELACEEEESQ
jgi:hypothetical protein